MAEIGDLIFQMMGRTDPRQALLQGLAGGGTQGAPQPALGTPGTGGQPGATPAPGAPGQPPQQPAVAPVYQSPPDMYKLYTDLLDRQEQNAAINRGLGLIAMGSAQPANKSAIAAAFLGGPTSTDPSSLVNNMMQFKQQQMQQQMREVDRARVPAIAKQLGIDENTANYLFDTGQLDKVTAEAMKPNREIVTDANGQHALVDKNSGQVLSTFGNTTPRQVDLVDDGNGGKIAVDSKTKERVGNGAQDIQGHGNTDSQKDYEAAMLQLPPDQRMTFDDWRKSDKGERYVSVGGGKMFDKQEQKFISDPNDGFGGVSTDPNNAPVLAPGEVNTDYLNSLPADKQGLIKGITDYTLDPTKISSVRGNERQQLVAAAKMYDPSFDMTQYGARAKMRQSVGAGPIGENIKALNTTIGHLGDLSDAGAALGNGNYPWINAGKNFIASETGSAAQNNFEQKRQAVASEMAKVFRGAGSMSEKEIGDWKDTLSSAQSPAQMKGAVDGAIALLASRMDAIKSQYNSTMNKPWNTTFLTPKSAQILKKLGKDPSELDSTIKADDNAAPDSLGPNPSTEDLIKFYGKKK